MKAKFNYKSKKTIIITLAIIILIVVAIVGTVAFIKGNKSSTAAMGENVEQVNRNTDSNSSSEADNAITPEENEKNKENLPEIEDGKNNTNSGESNNQTYQNNNNNSSDDTNNGTIDGTTNNNNNNSNVPNDEYTQQTEITVVSPWERKNIGWNPIVIAAYDATTNLGINKINLETEKLAYVEGDLLDRLPINNAIQKDQEITYVIKIANRGKINANSIRVEDVIPEGTTLVENSISNEGKYNEKTNKITWKVNVEAGKNLEVSFKVKVVEDEITLIKNIAKVNGKDTPETQNPVIKANKTVNIIEIVDDAEVIVNRNAKVGDKLRYTITIKNASDIEAITNISDVVPEGTTLVENSATEGAKIKDGKLTWINLRVPAKGEFKVSFDVTINADRKESVKNIALVGGKETPEVETKVANITGTKSVDKTEAKVGDILTYTITLTNNGNADGMVTVEDKIPEGTKIVDEKNPNYNKETNTMVWNANVKAGKTLELTFKVVINKDRTTSVVNVAILDGKEILEKPETKVANIVAEKFINNVKGPIDAKVGDILIYTIRLKNIGNANGKVTVEDKIPEGTIIIDENTVQYNKQTKTIIWENVEVLANSIKDLTFKVIINKNDVEKLNIKAIENIANLDTTPENKKDSTTPTNKVVANLANIIAEKTSSYEGKLTEDSIIHYTIKLTNIGNANGKITVTDTIPEGTKYVENSVDSKGKYDVINKKVEWKDIEVKVGMTVEISFDAKVMPFAKGEKEKNIINQASIGNEVMDKASKKYIEKEVNKVWKNDNENLRNPINVEIYANENELVNIIELTKESDWKGIFKNLPKYDLEGKEIKYSIKEQEKSVLDGYTSKVNGMTITNTYKEPTISKTVTKIWNDNNNSLNIRPHSIKLQLKNGEKVLKTVILTKENQEKNENTWTYTFKDLLKYDSQNSNRKPINYTVDEEEINEDELKYYTKSIDGTTITNTIKEPNIVSTKIATTENKYPNNEKAVQVGDKISYTIKIENKGDIYKTVKVKDTIPNKTKLEGNIKLNGENLTEKEINELYNGTLDLTIKEHTSQIIKFTVKVVEGNPGDHIINTAYVDEKIVGPVENIVEKFIDVTKFKNNLGSTNIMLVLDTSSSMTRIVEENKTRLDVAKDAINDFVKKTYAKPENKDVTFSLVTFDKREHTKLFKFGKNNEYIATKNTANNFIEDVNKLENGRGTNMRAGLEVAYETLFGTDGNGGIAGMEKYKDYERVVIFFGDGRPYGEENLNNNEKGIKEKANQIRKRAQVYSIGFGTDATIPGNLGYEMLKNIGGGKVYTSNNYLELVRNFSDIIGADPEYKQITVDGEAIVEITNTQNIVVDNNKNKIILTVGDEKIEITNKEQAKLNNLTYTDKKITWNVSDYEKDAILKISYHVQ